MKELQKQANPNIVIALVGNKTDLSASREVGQDEAKSYAEDEGLLFLEVSAKTGDNVSETFLEIGN